MDEMDMMDEVDLVDQVRLQATGYREQGKEGALSARFLRAESAIATTSPRWTSSTVDLASQRKHTQYSRIAVP